METELNTYICVDCYEPISPSSFFIRCQKCPLIIHESCFALYEFSHFKAQLNIQKDDNINAYVNIMIIFLRFFFLSEGVG